MRNYAWLVVATVLLSASLAHAQGMVPYNPPAASPYGNPGAYGYPGYGNPPPMMPYGMPVSRPMMPYGNSMPPNPGFYGRPTSQPAYDGNGPRPGAAEPYLVPPESSQSAVVPARPPMLPPMESSPGMIAAAPYDPAACLDDGPPPEPYTLYEGPRSQAEMKQDNTCFWVQANFIHWWVRRDFTPPLVTTGDPNNLTVGALGNPDTVTLLGNGSIAPTSGFSGVQSTIGAWLDDERVVGLELGGFWVNKNRQQYNFASDAAGNPALAQPAIINGVERALLVAVPATPAAAFNLSGTIAVNTVMDFHGAELNLTRNAIRNCGFTLDYFGGVRYQYLNEALTMDKNITVLPGADLQVPFNGVFLPAGSNLLINDSFNVTNRFYGGQIGAHLNWVSCRADFDALVKLGVGATRHTFIIDGASTLNAIDGSRTTLPGGTLAQPSNIGRFNSTDFSVIPELTLSAGYQITPHLRLSAGYTFMYWTQVMRVGNNLDRNIDPNQVPTQALPAVGPGTRPVFPAVRTDFWAQGVNVGVELRF